MPAFSPQDTITSIETDRRTFSSVLRLPCKTHAARPGEPCWTVVGAEDRRGHAAVCKSRIRARVGRG